MAEYRRVRSKHMPYHEREVVAEFGDYLWVRNPEDDPEYVYTVPAHSWEDAPPPEPKTGELWGYRKDGLAWMILSVDKENGRFLMVDNESVVNDPTTTGREYPVVKWDSRANVFSRPLPETDMIRVDE